MNLQLISPEIDKIRDELASKRFWGYESALNDIAKYIEGFNACAELLLKQKEDLSEMYQKQVEKTYEVYVENRELKNQLSLTIGTLETISNGILPNGDHVEGSTIEFAQGLLAKLKYEEKQ